MARFIRTLSMMPIVVKIIGLTRWAWFVLMNRNITYAVSTFTGGHDRHVSSDFASELAHLLNVRAISKRLRARGE